MAGRRPGSSLLPPQRSDHYFPFARALPATPVTEGSRLPIFGTFLALVLSPAANPFHWFSGEAQFTPQRSGPVNVTFVTCALRAMLSFRHSARAGSIEVKLCIIFLTVFRSLWGEYG
ncbi:hypothetical protein LshimejAT787_1701090 [Lyophyllum shimeji]|uniref:Uncharacterized protein n=1 Tax=Lyophyllum shimeji TaxID=47721 RepID=A0A9P3PWW1_LYOSH|nr:hypothetical protein LshimejAT787_1701090 [Lyophyllum shimeji]